MEDALIAFLIKSVAAELNIGGCNAGDLYKDVAMEVAKGWAEIVIEVERQACAKLIEDNSEGLRLKDSARVLSPRNDGDLAGLGYAKAIRARSEVQKCGIR